MRKNRHDENSKNMKNAWYSQETRKTSTVCAVTRGIIHVVSRMGTRLISATTLYITDDYVPCLEIAEFLRDNLADINAKAIDDSLGQIRVRSPAEDLDVRHSTLQDTHTGVLQVCA